MTGQYKTVLSFCPKKIKDISIFLAELGLTMDVTNFYWYMPTDDVS
jgi:hypothetical protein